MKFFALLALAAFAGLLVFATLYKYFEVRIAGRWPSVPGRVLSAKIVQRKVGAIGNEQKDEELRNFAEVTYQYAVQGRNYRASRISIGEDPGNYKIEETLAKYPAGAAVMVHYNPLRPEEAVLERDAPEGIFGFLFLLIAGLIALGLGIIFGTERLAEFLTTALPSGSNTSLAMMLGGMGLFSILLARALSAEAARTENWPSTWGVIETSGVETFQTYDDARLRERKRAGVVYVYKVNGRDFRGTRIGARDWKISSNLAGLVIWRTKKYPPGKPVEVFYDPVNPAEALLERRVAGVPFVYLIGVALLAMAGRAAGLY